MKRHNAKELTRSFFTLVGTSFCFVAIPLFLAGLLAFISPTMFFSLMEKLPEDIQYIVANDAIFSSFSLSWSYMIGAVVLWFLGNYMRE